MIDEHVQAVVTLLESAGLTVFRADARAATERPYVVLHTDSGLRSRTGLLAISDRFSMLLQSTCVGDDDWSVKVTADTVSGALLDVSPAVTGRSCWPIENVLSRPVQRDDDLPGQPEFYAVDQWQLDSIPA